MVRIKAATGLLFRRVQSGRGTEDNAQLAPGAKLSALLVLKASLRI